MVGGEADVSMRNHEALKGFEDMVLIGAAARGPMGEAAALEGNNPCSHIVPNGSEAPVVGSIVVRRSGVERIKVDVEECAMAAEAEGQGGKVVGVNVGECAARRATRGEEGFEAGIDDKAIECSKGGVTQARANRAEKVSEARPDTEAKEDIALIRGVAARGII